MNDMERLEDLEFFCRLSHNFLFRLKVLPFQDCFKSKRQPEVTSCRVWRVVRVPNKCSVVLEQISLDQVTRMGRCIVIVVAKFGVPKVPIICVA